jgi:hypothetical protein
MPIDKSETILCRDVNNQVKQTIGTIKLKIYNHTVKVHVISGLSKPLIVGWDTITLMNATLDAHNNSITMKSNGKATSIPFNAPSSDI